MKFRQFFASLIIICSGINSAGGGPKLFIKNYDEIREIIKHGECDICEKPFKKFPIVVGIVNRHNKCKTGFCHPKCLVENWQLSTEKIDLNFSFLVGIMEIKDSLRMEYSEYKQNMEIDFYKMKLNPKEWKLLESIRDSKFNHREIFVPFEIWKDLFLWNDISQSDETSLEVMGRGIDS